MILQSISDSHYTVVDLSLLAVEGVAKHAVQPIGGGDQNHPLIEQQPEDVQSRMLYHLWLLLVTHALLDQVAQLLQLNLGGRLFIRGNLCQELGNRLLLLADGNIWKALISRISSPVKSVPLTLGSLSSWLSAGMFGPVAGH